MDRKMDPITMAEEKIDVSEDRKTGMFQKMKRTPWMWMLPALILLVVVDIIPFIIALNYSFRSYSFSDPANKGLWIGLDNYRTALNDGYLFDSLVVTAKYLFPAVTLQLLLGLIIAMALSRGSKGHKFVIPFLVLPTIIAPVVVGLIGILNLNTEFGVIGINLLKLGLVTRAPLGDPYLALLTVILVDTWQWTPFIALILLAGLLSFPRAPYEAAQMDGASAWQTFRLITLPLLKPYLVIAILIRAIDAFKIFDIIYIMTRGGPGRTTEALSVYAYRITFRFWNLGYGAAVVLLIFLISMIASMVFFNVITRQKKVSTELV